MGLRPPFGYVGYEVKMAGLLFHILDNLCGSCHTNDDYGGCHGCPAGQLVYECRQYLLDSEEEDKRYAMYADGVEWLKRRKKNGFTDTEESR